MFAAFVFRTQKCHLFTGGVVVLVKSGVSKMAQLEGGDGKCVVQLTKKMSCDVTLEEVELDEAKKWIQQKGKCVLKQ